MTGINGMSLKTYRTSKRIAAVDISRGTGLTLPTVYAIEQGKDTKVTTLETMLDFLGLELVIQEKTCE